MNINFEKVTTLQYRLKAAQAELDCFKSGQKYLDLMELRRKDARDYKGTIKKLEAELASVRNDIIKNRQYWFEVYEDLQAEHEKTILRMERELKIMEERALNAERQRDEAKGKLAEYRKMYYVMASELENEKGRNLKLQAQLNRDFENSSLPSSKAIGRKKISNSRKKTGRNPGGQPGHMAHGRKKQEPTSVVHLNPPEIVLNNPDFHKTGQEKVRQMVSIKLLVETTEYHADVYFNRITKEKVWAEFPPGVKDDVNYDGSIKAFLYLLNNACNVSIDKSRQFLKDLTGNRLNISKGMVNKLCSVFSKRSRSELDEIFKDMLLEPVLHIDCTNAKANGKQAYVYVCASTDGQVLYTASEKKGHEGVRGTVAEHYQGILVHDHDKTFYSYATKHQECLAHVLRYLKNSIENESDREWNKTMYKLIQEMIHYMNGLEEDAVPDAAVVKDFEIRYDAALDKAKEEYEDLPPSDYYRDGYNLYKRMHEYRAEHLLFLHDKRVPATNNESERLLRNYKRKQVQATSFRSFDSIGYLCDGMSRLLLIRNEHANDFFNKVAEVFT